MGDLLGLLGTVLPNVGSEDAAACGKHDMSTSMVSLQLLAASLINGHVDLLALEQLKVAFKRAI